MQLEPNAQVIGVGAAHELTATQVFLQGIVYRHLPGRPLDDGCIDDRPGWVGTEFASIFGSSYVFDRSESL